MEEQVINMPVEAVTTTHLLQYTLRSLCLDDNSNWVYAVFWRILPRSYPPPKWELGQGGGGANYHHERFRGNRRNWILVWEDGFCNFADQSAGIELGECLKPEGFFKMSHEIYNYGEGLMGKVAADYSQKWVYKESNEQDIKSLSSSSWHNSGPDHSHPRTWAAQFKSGIKTIALIAVREGVLQLGSLHKVIEDLNYVVLLRKRLNYIESIPGVLLPHPSSSSTSATHSPPYYHPFNNPPLPDTWHFHPPSDEAPPYIEITPSMNSLEALLSKLPSVVPPSSDPYLVAPTMLQGFGNDNDSDHDHDHCHHHHQIQFHHHLNNATSNTTENGLTSYGYN